MSMTELLLLAVGLSMDAFAVSICKGLAADRVRTKHLLIAGLWFGGFQALMPLIGYLLGTSFADYITAVDHWIAFVLLGLIGANMIKESLSKADDTEDSASGSFGAKAMFPMAIATSIDALAVGVTFAFLKVDVVFSVSAIGITTFLLSAVGVKVGSIFGTRFQAKAEFAGGLILILLGVKILLEHTVLG